jgi:acyl-CoA synthetase (AMP-forming)/AMP-acid ligase II
MNFVRPARPLPEQDRAPKLPRLVDYPRYWAGRAPEREAVVFGDLRLTYGDLAYRVDACAAGLLAAGVRPGDRVATLSPPHPDYYVTFLATTSIGAIWLGLNPRYQRRELDYAVADATPTLVFARTTIEGRDYRDELAALAVHDCVGQIVLLDAGDAGGLAKAVSIADFLARGTAVSDDRLEAARRAVDPDAPALIVYTSGTTGRPKGALINQTSLVHVARVQHAIWPVDPLRAINNLPINHIGCVGDITVDTMVPGGTLVFQEQFDPQAMLEAVERERITFFGHVPTALQLITSSPRWATTDFSTVQLIIWEGAAAPVDLIHQLRAKCPALANAYGMTETVGSVTFTFDADEMDTLADSVGWPVPDYQLRIANEDVPVTKGEPGEIQVKGSFVTLGYWNKPEATRELFTDGGWLRTGDLAVERPNGSYKLIGRLKEMFKSGGYNVYPREIELVLESHPDVAMAAVIGAPDPLYQEVGHAFVLVPAGKTVLAEDLLAFCRARLANYKVPKRFVIAAEFPMLPIGKIDKQALRARTG